VTNHHGNAKCPILQEHMALKRKNIDLSLNLFLTAALPMCSFRPMAAAAACLWRKVMGLKIGSDGATTRESLEPPCVNKDCFTTTLHNHFCKRIRTLQSRHSCTQSPSSRTQYTPCGRPFYTTPYTSRLCTMCMHEDL
jgi:hypothetical protein